MSAEPEAVVVALPVSRAARRVARGHRLKVIDIINAEGRLILQTVWAIGEGRHAPTQTDFEYVAGEPELLAQLAELAGIIAAADAPALGTRGPR